MQSITVFPLNSKPEMLQTSSPPIHRALSFAEGKDVISFGTVKEDQWPFPKEFPHSQQIHVKCQRPVNVRHSNLNVV